jgi:RHS repeat-associated protein
MIRVGAAGWGWRAAVAVVVAVGVALVGGGSALAAGRAGESDAPVSNAFAMGGGVGGTVDQRTGAFRASFPLVAVGGRAGVGASLSLGYDQTLAVQGADGDRFGLGAGWSLGVPWVDTAGGVTVHPATGGSYDLDTDSPTGLRDYPLRDLVFAKVDGVVPARSGVPDAQRYAYQLSYLDGSEDRFDVDGNLVERVDRFGNRIDFSWEAAGPGGWHPTAVVDNYGQATSFDYGQADQVTVRSPERAGGVRATVVLEFREDRLWRITDPVDQHTTLAYTADGLLESVTSPTGAETAVSYVRPVDQEPALVVVDRVRVVDTRTRNDVLAEREFALDPTDPHQHNYTGYPDYHNSKPGADGLFESGDPGYRYTTELSDGTSTVRSTYNSLHLLTSRQVLAPRPGDASAQAQEQEFTYPLGQSWSPDDLPANFARPTATKVTYGDPQLDQNRRSVETHSSYDDRGQLVSSTNADGTVTRTEFDDRYGLPTKRTATGADGTANITDNTLTADGKAIAATTTAVRAAGQPQATARTQTGYSYNDSGELTGRSQTWAPGAQPPGPSGGPDRLDETRTVSVDPDDHTRTEVVTTAAGTPAAASTKTVSDLVTGKVLSRTDPAGRTTTYQYDAAGRITAVTAPGDRTTKTAYPTPLTTSTTTPDGHVRTTTTDVVGRTVKVTDNVADQKLVADPAARTLATTDYSVDGKTIKSSGPTGAPTTTTLDPFGRPEKSVKPNGITQTTRYDDVANTQTKTTIPAGSGEASAVTVAGFDDLNRATSSATTYPDGSPQAPTSQAYDGLGRVARLTTADVRATPAYTGAGGLQTKTALSPTDPEGFPGTPLAAATENTMTGAATEKTLGDDGNSTPGAAYHYDPAGRVDSVTGPGDAQAAYTYTPDGKVATVTSPGGVHTGYHYDPDTGQLDETDVTPSGGGATQKTHYDHDPHTGRVTAVFDPDHPGDRIGYDYDADGHIIAVHYPDGTTTAARYKDTGQLDTSTDITGAVTSYSYDAAGDLKAATQTRGGATLASVAYDYDALDRVATITRANGVKTAITYTDANQVKTETTTAPDGTPLSTSAYTYDAHGNLHSRTDQTPAATGAAKPRGTAKPRSAGKPGRARGRRRAAAPTISTTIYRYDAYNRLTGSAAYPNDSGTGTPTTQTTYTVNAAGDVTAQKTTTGDTTTSTTNTFGPGNKLTARTVDGKQTEQRFDPDGNVTRDLAGTSYSYDPTDHPTQATTPDGTTIAYRYWPDRTLRSTTTTDKSGTHTTTFHNNTTGVLTNDTYAAGPAGKAAAAAGDVTASYLYGLNRESRALVTDTGPGRSGRGAVRTTGPGAGYYLHDRHGSVTAMTDAAGQLTTSYRYSDYGQPTQTTPAPAGAGAAADAAVNPFTHCGAYTNPQTGNQDLPARSYDPTQGRFLTADSAELLNRYQAFNTNPINYCDPTGQWSVSDTFTLLGAIGAVIAAVATGGAAVAADAALFAAVEAGEGVAASAVPAALLTTSAAANVAAAGTSITLFADDAAGMSGHHFLTNDQRAKLTTATLGLGAIGTATGLGGGAAVAAEAAEDAEDIEVVEDVTKRNAIDPDDPRWVRDWPEGHTFPPHRVVVRDPAGSILRSYDHPDLTTADWDFLSEQRSTIFGPNTQTTADVSEDVTTYGVSKRNAIQLDVPSKRDAIQPDDLVGWGTYQRRNPAADTPFGPGPPQGVTQANSDALGAADPFIRRASTTLQNTLGSNTELLSLQPPGPPQDISPASTFFLK